MNPAIVDVTASDRLTPDLPQIAAGSYRELVELDGAHSVRWARKPDRSALRSLNPDPLDLEILVLVAALRHVLTTQIHRHFNSSRAVTTTQRRLKRLSDAGLLDRFQFHRRDGGGVPMCYVISVEGWETLRAHGCLSTAQERAPSTADAAGPHPANTSERQLRQARRDVHVAGWALALASHLGVARTSVRGADEAVLSPPMRSDRDGRAALGPGDLRLPGGRTPHDFMRRDAGGTSVEVDRFETLRPNAIIEVHGCSRERIGKGEAHAAGEGPAGGAAAIDLFLELHDGRPSARSIAKLERYEHFLAGWSCHTGRYGRRCEALPVVVFICRDRSHARDSAHGADSILQACRAYAGEYPFDWEYPARERMLFVSERDIHEHILHAFGVPRLPPAVRVSAAHGDPRAAAAAAEPRSLLDVELGGDGLRSEAARASER